MSRVQCHHQCGVTNQVVFWFKIWCDCETARSLGFKEKNLNWWMVKLILIIADQSLNYLLCCSYKCNWCLIGFMGKLFILLLSFLINVSKKLCIILHELFWIKFRPDLINYEIQRGVIVKGTIKMVMSNCKRVLSDFG